MDQGGTIPRSVDLTWWSGVIQSLAQLAKENGLGASIPKPVSGTGWDRSAGQG